MRTRITSGAVPTACPTLLTTQRLRRPSRIPFASNHLTQVGVHACCDIIIGLCPRSGTGSRDTFAFGMANSVYDHKSVGISLSEFETLSYGKSLILRKSGTSCASGDDETRHVRPGNKRSEHYEHFSFQRHPIEGGRYSPGAYLVSAGLMVHHAHLLHTSSIRHETGSPFSTHVCF